MHAPLKKVAIIGGGTAGWMTAAWLSKVMRRNIEEIVLVESEDIGTVGVGEATIPSIRKFNSWLAIDEDAFIRETMGTFKLGIEFVDWGQIGSRYHHSFGPNGRDLDGVPFHAWWLRDRFAGGTEDLSAYNLQTQAALKGKFMRPTGANSPLATIVYAFQFDASLYARYLRRLSEACGVKRTEGKVGEVKLRPQDGFIESVVLDDGREIAADLFIDCTGFRGLLIDQTLKSPFISWAHWLPCDRALAVPSERGAERILPFTRATARTAGWQWRIPLQHRTGNGHVFSSAFMTQEEANATLMDTIDTPAMAEPRLIRFEAGRRDKAWVKNCVAIGLAGGFLEPLESTSIFLIQNAIARLQVLFPDSGFNAVDIDFFNRETAREYEDVRDFIILHYKLTQRSDSPFWDYCRNMPVPERLERRIALFQSRGRIFEEKGEQFGLSSWLAVMWGQGLRPQGHDPMTGATDAGKLRAWLRDTREVIDECCEQMPLHESFIDRCCRGAC